LIEAFLTGQTVSMQSDTDGDGPLVSDVGSEIKVTLDQWTTGQLGFGDVLIALAIVGVGVLLALLAMMISQFTALGELR